MPSSTVFEKNKRRNFERLQTKKLLEHWENYSEWSHTKISKHCLARSKMRSPKRKEHSDPAAHSGSRLRYYRPQNFSDLLASARHITRVGERLYQRFESRLKLDAKLQDQRREFGVLRGRLNAEVIKIFEIPKPEKTAAAKAIGHQKRGSSTNRA